MTSQPRPARWKLFAVFALLTLVIPLAGFLSLGDGFESEIAGTVTALNAPAALFTAVACLLAVDLFLPVPSSVVLTYAGIQLGLLPAVFTGTIGLTLSAEIAYWIGRLGGRPLAIRFSTEAEINRLENQLCRRWPLWIVVTRPLPLIAEAATVAAGFARVPHVRYLAIVISANIWVTTVFAALGVYGGQEYQIITLAVSAIVPLSASVLLRKRQTDPQHERKDAA